MAAGRKTYAEDSMALKEIDNTCRFSSVKKIISARRNISPNNTPNYYRLEYNMAGHTKQATSRSRRTGTYNILLLIAAATEIYNNLIVTCNILLLVTGDVEPNPGEKYICSPCQRTIAVTHREILCSSCNSRFHTKCGPSKKYYKHPKNAAVHWTCSLCHLKALPF